MSSSALSGFLEEVDVRTISRPDNTSRRNLGDMSDLVGSIAEKGLLQPIVVRPIERGFEVIAGNRRLEACKALHIRKIACHVIDMNEKEAYEMSLVENIQRRTLDPIEEAEAMSRYVSEYGYGSVSELALKIGKSEEYVSHRIGLLTLPKDVLDKVSRRQLTPSHAAELKGLDEDQQLTIAHLIVEQHVSSREVRKMAKRAKLEGFETAFSGPRTELSSSDRDVHAMERTLGRCIAAVKVTMMRFDDVLADVGDEQWAVKESLLESRWVIHQQIDNLLRLKKKTQRVRVFLERHRT